MVRSTTNGVLRSYRFNLQRTTGTLNHARDTVLTGRQFNTYAEDPAVAARSFKLRTSFEQNNAQIGVSKSVVRKYEIAWSSISSVVDQANTAKKAILTGANPPSAAGRNALGQELCAMAETMVQTLNAKYGDNYVFAGADGKHAPFEITKDGKLTYRGVEVNTKDTDALKSLQYMAKDEHKFVDIGLGLEENNQNLNESSVFDTAIQGINFLGYGQDKDGNPNNLVSIIHELGTLLQSCDKNGNFTPDQAAKYDQLSAKFEEATHNLAQKYTELDTQASFLKDNQKQLETRGYTLVEQISELEDVDPADAITSYSWAQYCYNAALKVGNSILSQSLMDYMHT